jgi:hypothetical protein
LEEYAASIFRIDPIMKEACNFGTLLFTYKTTPEDGDGAFL